MLLAVLLCSCGGRDDRASGTTDKVAVDTPVIKVYNMGGVPGDIINRLVDRLSAVYDSTRFAGSMPLPPSAHIDNDRKGNSRYWFARLNKIFAGRTDTRREIALVIVNADVCNYTPSGSHANLGISIRGGNISFVSYLRLRVNCLDDIDNLLKVSVHELGHSVGALVPGQKKLRMHCPDMKCLMRDACNGYPYRNITSFCHSCDSVMRSRGFKTENLNF